MESDLTMKILSYESYVVFPWSTAARHAANQLFSLPLHYSRVIIYVKSPFQIPPIAIEHAAELK